MTVGRWVRDAVVVAAVVAMLLGLMWLAHRPDGAPAAAGPLSPTPPLAIGPAASAAPTEVASPDGDSTDPDLDPEQAADRLAGVSGNTVPPVGTGAFAVVPGSAAAPGPGPVRTVRVEVEGGLPIDAPTFAGFVMDTLNDPRSWGHGGTASFARTDGDAEITVVLGSQQTSEQLCRPLVTEGQVSCRTGARAVINFYRWVVGQADYGRDRNGYRRYVVNHEVGHVLGQVHTTCPGPGLPAPVMLQQTLGLAGCTPNPWPYP